MPLERHDLRGVGFEQARRRAEARTQATVLDLEREVPKIRAHAFLRWQEAEHRLQEAPREPIAEAAERRAF